ncbi:hypothetical protein [Psychromonas sp. MB-3u-54]|uniref:hypothetical protein n=1 Tax=Psychromonas sp. MB-3u-54 TaxID=2058319 RepID=UPI0018E3F989|nr:hypothetical protein [Psychromonas sp. MB-3u-54]
MSRPLRLEFSGALYHVTSRGNGRKEIYFEESDFELFIDLLSTVCGAAGVMLLGSGLSFCIVDYLL